MSHTTNYRLTTDNEWVLVPSSGRRTRNERNNRHDRYDKRHRDRERYDNDRHDIDENDDNHSESSSRPWQPQSRNRHYHRDSYNNRDREHSYDSHDKCHGSDRESRYDRNNDKKRQKNDNYKKILCKNINRDGKCIYNNKCLFAHNLEEQTIEPVREIAYDMIKNNDNLSHVDISKSRQLYNNLLCLSKLCPHCEEGTCTGGYNCKHGTCDKIYVICQTDLNKGTCDGKCGKLHLTSKGLVPYGKNIMRNLKTRSIPVPTIINDDFFKQLASNVTNIGQNVCEESNGDNDSQNMFDIDNNESICSDETDILSLPDVESNDSSAEDLIFMDNYKKEDKLHKSIFRIDIACI